MGVKRSCGESDVGQSRKRVRRDGTERCTAYYTDIQGRRRSAGTHATKALADRAWDRAERELDLGQIGDPKRGKQTLRDYVETEWFVHHVIEETTRENYRYLLNRYILPELGGMRMRAILPGHLREWIGRLQDVHQARPPTIQKCKVIVDAILTPARGSRPRRWPGRRSGSSPRPSSTRSTPPCRTR
jgi:Phage integrase, N-terminal SAM-like domain